MAKDFIRIFCKGLAICYVAGCAFIPIVWAFSTLHINVDEMLWEITLGSLAAAVVFAVGHLWEVFRQ